MSDQRSLLPQLSTMGTSSITLSTSHSLSSFPKTLSHLSSNPPHNSFTILRFQLRRLYPHLQASRPTSNFPQVRLGIEDYAGSDDDDDDEEEQEEDRSLDLLVKFVENVFKKVSRRARKAVRSVLPVTISTKLVGFSVNGVILLAFLWVLKAFLEQFGLYFLSFQDSAGEVIIHLSFEGDLMGSYGFDDMLFLSPTIFSLSSVQLGFYDFIGWMAIGYILCSPVLHKGGLHNRKCRVC